MDSKKTVQNSETKNSRLAVIVNLLMPSSLGVWIYIVIFGLTVVISQPSEYKVALQNFHISDLKGTFVYGLVEKSIHIIDTQLANEITIYVFWAIVASAVYLMAVRLTRNVGELTQDLRLRDYIWPPGSDKNRPVKEFIEKIIIRIIMAIIFLIYIFKILPVLANIWKSTNLTLSFSMHSLVELALLFIIEVAFLHLAVIIIRLFMLRSRIIQD